MIMTEAINPERVFGDASSLPNVITDHEMKITALKLFGGPGDLDLDKVELFRIGKLCYMLRWDPAEKKRVAGRQLLGIPIKPKGK